MSSFRKETRGKATEKKSRKRARECVKKNPRSAPMRTKERERSLSRAVKKERGEQEKSAFIFQAAETKKTSETSPSTKKSEPHTSLSSTSRVNIDRYQEKIRLSSP